MKQITRGLLFVAAASTIFFNSFAQNRLKLNYIKPAFNWNEALPIGNGRLAAMVFGRPEREEIQLNEETIWAGGPHNNVNADAARIVPELRKLIANKQYAAAQALANRLMFSKQNGMPYQTVGSLYIEFPGHVETQNYHRELNISKALASVSYSLNGVHFKREVFASFKDQAIVIRITADKPKSITCKLSIGSPMKSHQVSVLNGKLMIDGQGEDRSGIAGAVKFEAQVKVINHEGTLAQGDTALSVKNANDITIYVSIGTNFRNYHDVSGNASAKTTRYLNRALKKSYPVLLRENIAFYQHYFNRVSFKLGNLPGTKKPTDERIRDFDKGGDLNLVPLFYQFGRYLLICSSQPGNQAANLQGKWNQLTSPPWGGKYTININTEMNYWPAEETKLSELTGPLIDLIKDLSVTGKESAEKMYRARGWMAHHNTDIWRISGQVDNAFYGIFPTGGAWLTEHLWEHYNYTGDKIFLKEIYPGT